METEKENVRENFAANLNGSYGKDIFIVTSNLSVFSMKILNSEVINQQSLNDGLYGLSNISIDSKNEFLNIQQDRTRQTNGRRTACLFW